VFVNYLATRVGHLHAATAVLALASLALVTGCQREGEELQAEIRPVRVMTIESRDSNGALSLTGTVQAQAEINLSFRIDGRMIMRTVDIGDSVKAGQLIARLDQQDEERGLQAARAQLAAARAQLIEARNNYGRMRELVAQDAVSRATYDQAEALLGTADAQVKAVKAQVDLAKNRLSYTRLLSDVAGVVTARGPEAGEVVGAGRMVVQVARDGARDAVFGVPAQIKDSAQSNSEITVFLTSDPQVTAVGKVREISPRADPVTGTFAVRIGLLNPPPAMRLGSTVTGRLKLSVASSIEVPASALTRAGGKPAVWVVDAQELTVSLRTIEVRGQDTAKVQVGAGLNPGDVVVTAGVQALRPGQKVRLLEASKS
jgi:RND family efflux transporter MFP subunit